MRPASEVNDLPPERGGIHQAWRDPPSVEGTPRGAAGPEGCPRHARWIPTREGVNHLHQELRPQVFTLLYVSFCANKWLRPADCVVTRSVTKLGGLGACPHSRKRPHRDKMNTKIGIHACDPGRDFCIYPSASDQQRDFCSG